MNPPTYSPEETARLLDLPWLNMSILRYHLEVPKLAAQLRLCESARLAAVEALRRTLALWRMRPAVHPLTYEDLEMEYLAPKLEDTKPFAVKHAMSRPAAHELRKE